MNVRCKPGEVIRILITDSDLIRRQLLARELQRRQGLEVKCCGNDSHRATLDTFPADVLLWCGSSNGDFKNVLSGIVDVLRFRPDTRCIALAESWDKEQIVGAFRAGARGLFSLQDGSIDDLLKCVICVYRNQIWANSAQLLHLIEAFKRSPVIRIVNVKGKNLLTVRQQQLVELVAEGMGNREVAHHLNITENTVKKSLLRIFDKVGVSNRVELVLSALAFKNQDFDDELPPGTHKPPETHRTIFEEKRGKSV